MTYRLLTLCKVIDKRLWGFAHPLRQFPSLSHIVLNRLEEKKLSVDKLKEMRKDEIGKFQQGKKRYSHRKMQENCIVLKLTLTKND